MTEFIHLINDISTSVKLGWVGVLVWGVVQFVWYQRGRVLPEDVVESTSEGWSAASLLARFRRSSDDAEEPGSRSVLSIAPSMDLRDDVEPENDLDFEDALEAETSSRMSRISPYCPIKTY